MLVGVIMDNIAWSSSVFSDARQVLMYLKTPFEFGMYRSVHQRSVVFTRDQRSVAFT